MEDVANYVVLVLVIGLAITCLVKQRNRKKELREKIDREHQREIDRVRRIESQRLEELLEEKDLEKQHHTSSYVVQKAVSERLLRDKKKSKPVSTCSTFSRSRRTCDDIDTVEDVISTTIAAAVIMSEHTVSESIFSGGGGSFGGGGSSSSYDSSSSSSCDSGGSCDCGGGGD